MEELKLCPFCGERPEIQTVDEGYHQVYCADNHTATIYIESFEEWNKRPIEDTLTATIAKKDAEIERLREALKRILDIKPSNSPSMAARIYDMKEIAKQALKEVNDD